MKAYQIKIELQGSNPLIWRRVVVPTQITFEQLHKVIQNSLNFQDLYTFVFHFPTDNLKVTNDHKAQRLYAEYKQEQAELEKVLSALGTAFAQKQLEAMRTAVYKPEELEIDEYLQKEKVLEYTYSEEDNWQILLTLEQVVDDYDFAHPTLLAGEGTAPPESVKGLAGFYDFLEVYQDPNHPDYVQARSWAEQQQFAEYDEDSINQRLAKLIFTI